MLSAYCVEKDRKIVAASIRPERWAAFVKCDFRCPLTGAEVRPRREHIKGNSSKVTAHYFAKGPKIALPDGAIFDDEFMDELDGLLYLGGESMAHRWGKIAVAEFYQTCEPEWGDFDVSMEERIDLPSGKYRIADTILREKTSGELIAVEIQLAVISVAELERRTSDYESAGISCYWWFGGRAATYDNLAWYEHRFGAPAVRLSAFTSEEADEEEFRFPIKAKFSEAA